MRRPGGYLVQVDPEAGTVERDTFTCVHCNRVVVVEPRAPELFTCQLCSAPICRLCAGKVCQPFERKIEVLERRDRLRRAAEGA